MDANAYYKGGSEPRNFSGRIEENSYAEISTNCSNEIFNVNCWFDVTSADGNWPHFSKPDCSHVDDSVFRYKLESCDSYVGCAMLSSAQWYNGSVYLLEYDEATYDVTLVRISRDGSVHERLMKVGQVPTYGAYYKYVFADEDTIYMTYDDPET